ncbi:MAG: UDP-N-acetylmuramoylalanine--D-glutamate ligase [Gammaproteobacteria bacterium RBG_16_57_12]|nr:MAG: UDP-N-acetylmuramoylalanine--D-glutamate ligase [Gammaproteobacteria bacterium RBG_16_57_12]
MATSRQSQAAERTLIVGLGKSGLSCVRFLVARGEKVAVTDTRINPPALATLREEFPDVPVFVGGFEAGVFHAATRLVVSPGVSLKVPEIAEAIASGIPVLGDIELFARQADAPVVAVTGANGKSTVTTLVGEMARRCFKDVRVGGNLGTPALELLGGEAPDLYVLELSSFQLETLVSLNARVATVLNITPDHMDRYASVAEYAAAKQRIFAGDGVMVLNADDPLVTAMAEPGRRVIYFGQGEPANGHYGLRRHEGEEWLAQGKQLLLPASKLRLFGRHNIANVLAALAMGEALGLAMTQMLAAAREFSGLPHRCQWVAEQDGVTWYNDSKGTNVGAAMAAIQGLPGKVIWIGGGEGKGADFTPLRDVMKGKVSAAILIGRDAPLIEAALRGVVPIHHAPDMAAAVAKAGELAQVGDNVLLSPACASFDMFTDYQDRGNVFVREVRRLPA